MAMKKSLVAKLVGSVLVGAAILAGCGGEPDLEASQVEVEAWLQTNGYSAQEAECVAIVTNGDFDLSDFEKLDESDQSDEDGLASNIASIREKCAR